MFAFHSRLSKTLVCFRVSRDIFLHFFLSVLSYVYTYVCICHVYTFSEHFQITLGSLWGHFRVLLGFILGSFLNPAGCCRRPEHTTTVRDSLGNKSAPCQEGTSRVGVWRLRRPRQRRRRRRRRRRRLRTALRAVRGRRFAPSARNGARGVVSGHLDSG